MPHESPPGYLGITLIHSPIGRPACQRVYLRALGLRKLHQTVKRPKTAQVYGLLRKVQHLVRVSDDETS
ncbi:MAG: 50S ribosomal protein L30 [Nitrospirae bacterium]|nr:MAG: 50S ribosomal protein L30 [Nitrospirota bacterium]